MKPFMTQGLLKSRNHKFKLDLIRKNHPSMENIQAYKKYLTIYSKTLKLSKRKYFEEKFRKFAKNPKKTWEIINEVSNKSNSKQSFADFIEVDNRIIQSPEKMADAFNKYFAEAGINVAKGVDSTNCSFEDFLPPPLVNSFFFQPLIHEDVRNAIKLLNKKNSVDINDISVNFLAEFEFELSFPLAHIFNLSVQNGVFPNGLKVSKVVPVYKKDGCINNLQNYRPIAMVNTFSKILEKIMALRLTNFLNKQDFFYDNQFGFLEGRSTNDAIQKILNFISDSLNKGDYCIGIFLDIKKAFDTVDHYILLKKLENIGVRGVLNTWFKSFLSNREQKVMVNGVLSAESTFLEMSVLQGSILGVLLFVIFINDFRNATSLLSILYADDSTGLASGPNLSELETLVNTELQKMALWFKCNNLALNIKKSKCMLFSLKTKKEDISVILNNNDIGENDLSKLVPLEQVTNKSKEPFIRVLGFYINETLDIQDHGSILISKLVKAVYLLNRVKHLLSEDTKKMLYYAHFHSHLNYCSIFFTLLPQKIMKKLITLQKKAVRAIAKASFRAHTEPIFIHLNILPLDSLIQFNLLTFMHKYINFKVPKTFAHTWPTNFEYNNNLREMRRSGDFYIQRCHSNKLKKHPFFNLPLQWNNFVHQTKFILEPLEFKYELKRFLMSHLKNAACTDQLCYTCGRVSEPLF
jgi:hypothetical protein